ncbi:YceI family protein [Streptomyces sp. NPDC051976]|uniref:YceI family protein n=1 Tax=Streptomyces sp. NPDC051976 TaxID=3154947 RepID=UPI00343643E7
MTLTIPPAGDYKIDPEESGIHFKSTHMFGLGSVTGTFALRSGHVSIASPLTASSAEAVADATSFSTGSDARDKKVLSSAFLDPAAYPEISFTSVSAVNADGTWILRGTLTAHGVDAPVEFTVTDSGFVDGTLHLAATATVDRYAHGITAMKGMAGRYLHLTVTVQARQ